MHQEEMIREQMMMFEAARAAAESAASGVASGAGGGFNPMPDFYFFGTDNYGSTGYQFNVDSLGNLSGVGQLYNGITVFCKNPDNGITYYIEMDTDVSQMVIGILNPASGERQVIDTTVLDDYYAVPSSLFYIGNNQFLYLNNCPLFGPTANTIQNILLLNITNNGIVTIEENLAEWDHSAESLILTTLFKVGNDLWVTVTPSGYPLSGIGKLVLDPVQVLDTDFLGIEELPFPNYKFWFVIGITKAADGIYINSVVNDKDAETLRFCIAKVDVENYTSQYVQEIGLSPFTPLDIEAK